MHNEISDYLRMIDDADNAHSPTSRAVYADALIDVLRDIFTDEEIQALAQAKADGRLVVLPCKVGDTLFLIKHGYIEEAKVRTIFIGHPSYNRGEPEPNLMMIRCTNFGLPIDAIGKTAFLSREAAEKALGGGEE